MPRSYRLGFPGQILLDLQHETDLGRHWFWQLGSLARQRDCIFIIIESPSFLQKVFPIFVKESKASYYLPYFVRSVCNISNVDQLLNGNESLKSDIRRIKKLEYKLQVTTDPKDFRQFLELYYQPYVKASHGFFAAMFDYSFLYGKEDAKRHNWELIQIISNDVWIAGALIRKDANCSDLMEIGVKEGNLQYMKQGAVAATYWFFI